MVVSSCKYTFHIFFSKIFIYSLLQVLKINPRIELALSYEPREAGFDIKFWKNPSSPASFVMSGKLDMRFGRNAAVSIVIENEGRKVFDISGSSQSHQSPDCYGIKVEGMAYSSVTGTYEYSTKMCKPAFCEVTVKKEGSDKMYATKVGVKGMKHVELSISEVDPEIQESRALGMARAELASPSLLMIETKYESDHLDSIKVSIEIACTYWLHHNKTLTREILFQ